MRSLPAGPGLHPAATPFGDVLVASTPKGICSMAFADDRQKTLDELRQQFPGWARKTILIGWEAARAVGNAPGL